MSDFDKEAERERLREKYERDKAKREATERMSDLLLKGATMTNAHCGECGDPVFRHDGQEFCPSCQTVIGDAEEAETDASSQADAPDQATAAPDAPDRAAAADAAEVPTPDTEPSAPESAATDSTAAGETKGSESLTSDGVTDGAATESDVSSERVAETTDQRPSPDHPGTQSGPEPGQPAADDPGTSDSPNPPISTGDSERSATEPTGTGQEGGLAEARASLTRTVTRLARQAEASEDIGRCREYLTATREAADALAAVREADR
jgi:uncharacterized Zn finger protein (UPF0148 family)